MTDIRELLTAGWQRIYDGKHAGMWRNAIVTDAFYYTTFEALRQHRLQTGKNREATA